MATDNLLSKYTVVIIREEGADPLSGERYEYAEETMKLNAASRKHAYHLAQSLTTIIFRGQVMRILIDGEEYYNSKI